MGIFCKLVLEGLADAEEEPAAGFPGALVEFYAIIQTQKKPWRADSKAQAGGLANIPEAELRCGLPYVAYVGEADAIDNPEQRESEFVIHHEHRFAAQLLARR